MIVDSTSCPSPFPGGETESTTLLSQGWVSWPAAFILRYFQTSSPHSQKKIHIYHSQHLTNSKGFSCSEPELGRRPNSHMNTYFQKHLARCCQVENTLIIRCMYQNYKFKYSLNANSTSQYLSCRYTCINDIYYSIVIKIS